MQPERLWLKLQTCQFFKLFPLLYSKLQSEAWRMQGINFCWGYWETQGMFEGLCREIRAKLKVLAACCCVSAEGGLSFQPEVFRNLQSSTTICVSQTSWRVFHQTRVLIWRKEHKWTLERTHPSFPNRKPGQLWAATQQHPSQTGSMMEVMTSAPALTVTWPCPSSRCSGIRWKSCITWDITWLKCCLGNRLVLLSCLQVKCQIHLQRR